LLYTSFLKDRIEPLSEAIENGKKNGELRTDINTSIALDMLLGPLFMRVLSGEHGIDEHFATHFPSEALKSMSA